MQAGEKIRYCNSEGNIARKLIQPLEVIEHGVCVCASVRV